MKLLKILIVFVLCGYGSKADAQVPQCYIDSVSFGIRVMSKEQFLKSDSLRTTEKDYLVRSYDAVFSQVNMEPVVFYTRGAKIDPRIKEWVRLHDSCVITFDQVRIYPVESNENRMLCAPCVFKIK